MSDEVPAERPRRRGSGPAFSLIEFVIIVLIIAVLAGIALAVQWSAQQGVRDAAAKANVTAAVDAIGRYAFANDGRLPTEREFADGTIEFANPASGDPGHVRYSLGEEGTRFCVAAEGDGDREFVADQKHAAAPGTCVEGVAEPAPVEETPSEEGVLDGL